MSGRSLIGAFGAYLLQVLLGSALGISRPQAFDWFHSGYFTTSLGFLMLSMGLTLTFKDFKEVSPLWRMIDGEQIFMKM